jgi:zinc/manganese transport system substrate-binding protein
MGNIVRLVPKSELERIRLVREARAIYDSIFPPTDVVGERPDGRVSQRTQPGEKGLLPREKRSDLVTRDTSVNRKEHRRQERDWSIVLPRYLLLLTAIMLLGIQSANADKKLDVVATFSILGDFVKNVGGDRVNVNTLVGPNGNTHVCTPSPTDARKLADANVIFVNGLGLEGWLDRLIQASGTKAPIIVATKGIKPRENARKANDNESHGRIDPDAWQSVENAKTYVENIRSELVAADPEGKTTYEANARSYLARLDQLDRDVRSTLSAIPSDRRLIVTNHRAFGYFEQAYDIKFASPQGLSTEAEPSARNMTSIITSIKQSKAPAVFLENITNPRLMQQIASEAGVRIGGTLYSDALTDEKGDAPTYIDLVRHNLRQLSFALSN